MFFVLSKLVGMVIYPLPFILILLLVVWVGYHHRYMRWLLAGVLLILYSLSAPITAAPLVHWLERPPPPLAPAQPHYDVAIVLAGMVHLRLSTPQRLEFSNAVERILTGISLVKHGVADTLLITGSTGDLFGRGNEARLLRSFALEWGLTSAQILTEEQSRNTYENAVYSAQIIRTAGYKTLLLVTSAAHMRRAAAVFHKQGLFPDLYPVDFHTRADMTATSFLPSAAMLAVTTEALHELIGLVAYRFQGYI